MESDKHPVPSGTQFIPLNNYNLVIPKRTARLLYVSDADPSRIPQTNGIVLTINIIGGQININNLSENEPSTIYTKMLVRKPSNPDEIPRPNYYPTYAGLTPEQKWIYLNWLSNIPSPVNIGYVFIYYYGLERHLLLGDFDTAFEEIQLLRKHHQNQSFLFYSGAALLHSCVFRKRPDMLERLNQSEELTDLGNSELLLVYPNLEHATLKTQSDPSKLMPQLLDQLISLGELARQISHALGSNGHRPEKVSGILKQLAAEVDDDL